MPVASFRLLTLGRLALLDASGVEDKSLGTRRRKLALLAVLASPRRPVSRDALIDMFWGDQDEDRARHSLSDTLSHLRRALGADSITTRRAEVELSEHAPLLVDAMMLSEAADAGRWAEVVTLYQGPFLDAVHVGASPRWEQWVDQQRVRMETMFQEGCKRECARLAQARDWTSCAALADRWLAQAPMSPHAALHLMASLSAQGAPEELHRAIAAYDRLVRRLKVEYDAAPDARVVSASKEIAERIRQMQSQEEPSRVSLKLFPEKTPEVTPLSVPASRESSSQPVAPRGPARRARRWLIGGGLLAAAVLFATPSVRSIFSERDQGGQVPTAADRRTGTQQVTTQSPVARALHDRAVQSSRSGAERAEVIALLEQAIAADSTFASAYRRLALLYAGDEHSRARTRDLLTAAHRHTSHVSDEERQLIVGDYHMLVTRDYSRSAAAFRALLAIDPDNSSAWHNLGMMYQYVGDERRAADAYRSAVDLSPRVASTWGNLIDALYASGDRDAARRALEAMERALPGHPGVFVQSANLASADADFARAEQQVRAYLTTTRTDVRDQAIGYRMLARVLWSAGRHQEGDEAQRRAIALDAKRGDRSSALRESMVLVTAHVWQQRARRARMGDIDAALSRFPLDSIALSDRPLPEVATALALAGSTTRARAFLARYIREVPSDVREADSTALRMATGTIALVDGNFREAVTQFAAAGNPICTLCGLPELGLAYEALGAHDSALVVYRRYVEVPTLRRTDLSDAMHRRWVDARGRGVNRNADGPVIHARLPEP